MRRALFAAALALAACDYEVVVAESQAELVAPSNLPAFFDCLRERDAAIVSAHRGGRAPGLAENSIETFTNTLRQAPVFMEIDVARTRDGVLVLMHDDTVDRTTTGEGGVHELTLTDLQQLRLQDERGRALRTHPPTLREALDWANHQTVLELDVKRGVSYEDVAREVEAAGAMDRVIFITYSVDGTSRLARVAPGAMIYTTVRDQRDLDTLERRGVDLTRIVAWLGDDELDEDLLAALNSRGVEARFGMFGRGADFGSAIEAGVQGLSVDDALGAYRAADAGDGVNGYAALQCIDAR